MELCYELPAANQNDFAVEQIAEVGGVESRNCRRGVKLLFHDVAFEVVVRIGKFSHNGVNV